MKFFFSTCLFFALIISHVQARDIFIIAYKDDKQHELAQMMEELMIEHLGLPKKFIQIQKRNEPCLKSGQPIAHFCFDEDGNIWPVTFNEDVILKSMQVFLKSENFDEL
jgi:hypothetical protein